MIKINAEEFDEIIYDDEEKVLAFFHKKGCSICGELSELLEDLEIQYGSEIKFAEVDVEEENTLFSRFGLKGVPQVLLFADGNPAKTISGLKDEEVYVDAIEKLIGE